MRRILVAASAALTLALTITLTLVSGAGPAAAAQSWREIQSHEDRFAVGFPGTPKAERQTFKTYEGHLWKLDLGKTFYEATVYIYQHPINTGGDFYTRLVDAYAKGSNTMVRAHYSTTMAGYHGMEAVTDDGKGLRTVFDFIAIGNRLYALGSGSTDPDWDISEAKHFRESFRFISK
jgi:hypothetical protein